MLTYDQLDAVADLVNPLLLLVSLVLPAFPSIRARLSLPNWYSLVALAMGVTYGLMAIDHALGLWASIGADYSTHTAFAATLVITWRAIGMRALSIGLVVLFAYALLMLYQRYHSVLDIASTFVVVAIPMSIAVWKCSTPRAIAT